MRDPLAQIDVDPGGVLVLAYERLSPEQIDAVFALRAEVFLVEQGITSVPDRDGLDPKCEHVLVYAGYRLVGTARLRTLSEQGVVKVGRVAVSKAYRGRGVGRAMMRRVQAVLMERGIDGTMHAQAYLEGWYAGLGWVAEGEVFTEAGLAHRRMVYRVADHVMGQL